MHMNDTIFHFCVTNWTKKQYMVERLQDSYTWKKYCSLPPETIHEGGIAIEKEG